MMKRTEPYSEPDLPVELFDDAAKEIIRLFSDGSPAIRHHAAHYNTITGGFEWNDTLTLTNKY